MTLSELAASIAWPFGLILDDPQVRAQAVNAARQYLTWGSIASLTDPAIPELDQLSEATDLTASEWGVIKPLFALYVERENARGWEASRNNGVDAVGRTVPEIEMDIRQYEAQDMPRMAFSQAPESI